MNTPRTAEFLREQLAMNLECYMQVRPGSRAAAEVIRDRQALRDELAQRLRADRRATKTYTVRNMECEQAMGWMARAINVGLRVLSRPVRFGAEECIVKRDGAAVRLTQARHIGKALDVTGFSPTQMGIVRDLQAAGLIS